MTDRGSGSRMTNSTSVRPPSPSGPGVSTCAWLGSVVWILIPRLGLSVAHPQHREERFLRDLHAAHRLHPLLAFLLLFQELALAGDVAPVALRDHVLPHRPYGFGGNHLAAQRRLDAD